MSIEIWVGGVGAINVIMNCYVGSPANGNESRSRLGAIMILQLALTLYNQSLEECGPETV